MPPRRYFVATYPVEAGNCQVVIDYDLHGFDPRLLWNGNVLGRSLPDNISIELSKGTNAGWLPNPLSWCIVSREFLIAVKSLIDDHCEIVNFPAITHATSNAKGKYEVINPLIRVRAVPAVDFAQGWDIPNLRLDHSLIPDGIHIFRMDESPTIIIISEEFRNSVYGRYCGLETIAIDVY